MHNNVQGQRNENVCKQTYDASCTAMHMFGCRLAAVQYSSRQKWCPESEAGLFQTIVEHTAAELFDAATQDR